MALDPKKMAGADLTDKERNDIIQLYNLASDYAKFIVMMNGLTPGNLAHIAAYFYALAMTQVKANTEWANKPHPAEVEGLGLVEDSDYFNQFRKEVEGLMDWMKQEYEAGQAETDEGEPIPPPEQKGKAWLN